MVRGDLKSGVERRGDAGRCGKVWKEVKGVRRCGDR